MGLCRVETIEDSISESIYGMQMSLVFPFHGIERRWAYKHRGWFVTSLYNVLKQQDIDMSVSYRRHRRRVRHAHLRHYARHPCRHVHLRHHDRHLFPHEHPHARRRVLAG